MICSTPCSTITYIDKKRWLTDISFIVPMSLIFLMLLLKNMGLYSIPNLVFLLVSIFLCAFSSRTQILSFCLSCIPLTNVMQSKYILLICLIMYSIRFRKELIIKPIVVLPLLLMMFWELHHAFIGSFSFVEYLRQFCEFIFCTFLLCINLKKIDLKYIFRTIAVSSLFVCLLILLVQLKENSYNISLFLNGRVRFGYGTSEESLTVGFNPNILGTVCLVSIQGLLIVSSSSKKYKFLDVCLILLLTLFGMFTMSRKFIVSFLLFLVIYVLLQNSFSKRVRNGLILLVLTGLIFLVLNYAFPNMLYGFIERFNADDVSNGRNELLTSFDGIISNNSKVLFFGVGMQDYYNKVMTSFYVSNIPHNCIQEIIMMWGILGLILFVWYIMTFVFYAKKNNANFSLLNIAPLIVFFIGAQTGQWISSSVYNLEVASLFLMMLVPICKRRCKTNES